GGLQPRTVGDIEEVLADPAVDAVIVAGSLAVRASQLRRALQSERHVLCVHPADIVPDIAYEAAMIQQDTRRALVPMLTESLHPAVAELSRLVESTDAPLGAIRMIRIERPAAGLVNPRRGSRSGLSIPGWDVLRRIGGEIAEISAYAEQEEIQAGE